MSCANAYPVSFFNTEGNWGAGAGQIGPGTTVHLCGTLTFNPGATGLTVYGSGTSGQPITILFEPGAVLQAPYFGGYSGAGGIYVNGYSYITIDGGSGGIIQNTANGTSLANQQSSDGIDLKNTSNVTVQNLVVRNIYVNAGSQPSRTDTAGQTTMDIELEGAVTNLVIANNTLTGSRMGINTNLSGNLNGLTVYDNSFSDHAWMASITSSSSGTMANVSIYGNSFTNWDNWQFPTATYHTDGIFLYMLGGNENAFTPQVYNNYFYGNLGDGNSTAYVYLATDLSGKPVNFSGMVYNNLFLSDAHTTYTGGPTPGFTPIVTNTTTGPHYIYNNTFVAPLQAGQAIFEQISGGVKLTLENNIFSGFCNALLDDGVATEDVVLSNNNVFYNQCSGGNQVITDSTGQMSLAAWQGHGFDLNSSSGNPNLSSGQLQPGSVAINIGANLTSLGVAALDIGAPAAYGVGGGCRTGGCTPRPISGPWTAGVYPYALTAVAPGGLAMTVR